MATETARLRGVIRGLLEALDMSREMLISLDRFPYTLSKVEEAMVLGSKKVNCNSFQPSRPLRPNR